MNLQRLTYLLWVFLAIFGIFYSTGTLNEDSLLHPYTDLWANLFASLIVLLVIEHIIIQSKLVEIEPSKRYIKGRILHTLLDLIVHSMPPSNWKTRLETDLDWEDYFENLLSHVITAMEENSKTS